MTERTLDGIETAVLPEGYIVRPPRADEYVAVAAMLNAYSLALTGEEHYSAEWTGREWQTPGWDREKYARVVIAPDGVLAGYGELWNIANPRVRPIVWGRVHPDHQDLGIGTYLLRWAEALARAEVDQAPAGTQVAVTTYLEAEDEAGQALLRAEGMDLVRHSWRMEILFDGQPPALPQWPEGITVRSIQPGEAEREAYKVVRAAFKDHWGFIEAPFEEAYERWLHYNVEREDYDPSLRFVALDGDRIVGVSMCWPSAIDDPEMGWLGTLGVLREYRGRGIAKALLLHTFGEFFRRGLRGVGLGVDASSLTGATHLYRSVGMHVAREHVQFLKELRPGVDVTTQSAGD